MIAEFFYVIKVSVCAWNFLSQDEEENWNEEEDEEEHTHYIPFQHFYTLYRDDKAL